MKSLAARLAVALVTFTVGVSLAALTFRRPAPRAVSVTYKVQGPPQFEYIEIQSSCETGRGSAGRRDETREEKAVRLAEEFVARNGYTDLPPDRENLSDESIEWSSNVDARLSLRRDSLEREAYGLRYGGKMGRSGWMVVFKYRKHYCDACDEVGRVVTMGGDLKNLRVEHQDFFLKAVDKKL